MEKKALDPLRQHILEAVDCLRQRKCRPDRESIAHYVLRKFGSTMNEIFAELENIVDENGLIKVEYKGTTSYRSPSSFDTKNSPLLTKHSKILNSSKTTRFILTGINELLVKDPNYAKEGVPLHELKEALVGFDGVRFGEENMDVVLEREKNYGNIQIAKSTVFTDSLRVFPKDIPVPADMLKFSLSAEIASGEKEDKKPRKPRKNAAASAASAEAGTSPVKKGKGKGKKEEVEDTKPVVIFAVKSEPPPETETATDECTGADDVPPKKNARLTSVGRKTVAVQVAEAVRKTYEAKSEFENKSAQMIKLAAALVGKQVDETPKQKGPMLVLAESIKGKSRNGEASHMDDFLEASAEEASKLNHIPAGGKKRRGRPLVNLDTDSLGDKDEDSKDEVEEDEEMDNDKASPTNDQGLTRSKRDKRKKQVFDPSDLPKTYSNYSSSKSLRNSRANRSPSFDEPPAKKTAIARPSRASQRKNLPVETEEKRVSRSNSKKISDESQANKITQPVKNPENEVSDESVLMDVDNTEKETRLMELTTRKDKEPEKNNVHAEKEISAIQDSEAKPIPLPLSKTNKLCEYCQENKKKDSLVDDEEFLSCASCLANIHPRCVDYSTELTIRIRELDSREESERIPWKCFKCKTCGVCQQSLFDLTSPSHKRTSGSILSKTEGATVLSEKGDKLNAIQFNLCENCDAGFHAKCIEPETNVIGEAWICQECKAVKNIKKSIPLEIKTEKDVEKKKSLITVNKTVRSVKKQPVPKSDVKLEKPELPIPPITKIEFEKPNIDEKVVATSGSTDTQSSTDESESLDITSWSPSEVEAFFIDKGLKDEAAILREQDVDGYSLLLLRREDIIHGLRLRLGPALKVNRLIHELQAKAPVRPKWHDVESTDPDADVPVTDASQR